MPLPRRLRLMLASHGAGAYAGRYDFNCLLQNSGLHGLASGHFLCGVVFADNSYTFLLAMRPTSTRRLHEGHLGMSAHKIDRPRTNGTSGMSTLRGTARSGPKALTA